MALKVAGAPSHQTAYRPRLRSTRRFSSSMGKDGSGCLPRIGKRAPAFTASCIEDRQGVEARSHVGVVRTERCFADDQRALEEPLSLAVLALVSINIAQVVQALAYGRVTRKERLFADHKGALEEPLRLSVFALISIHKR